MFLGAGSVMHGMNDDVDMRHYGALRSMPVTFLTFAMGYLAIIGFPGFSGFWSKDKIIETALAENWLVGLCALLGAGITGFYMTRLMLMTFFGDKRWEEGVHPHESPKVMTIPLIVLAALSVLGGVLLLGDWIVEFLAPVVGEAAHHEPPLPAIVPHAASWWLWWPPASPLAWFLVGRRTSRARRRKSLLRDPRRPRRPVRRRHQRGTGGGTRQVADHGLASFDRFGVDGVVEGGSAGVGGVSGVTAPGPERLRPLLCPLPARRRATRRPWPSWR